MKSLKSVIRETYSLDKEYYQRNFLEDMNEFFNNDIPSNILDKFQKDGWVDYVWENLQTHDYKLLQNQLEKYFGDNIIEFIDQSDESGIFAIRVKDKYLHRDTNFRKLIEFYGYFIREINQHKYVIEPTYSQKRDDWVYNECNGVVYHFTDNDTADSILSKGLRIKGRERIDFSYPKRIYLYAPGFYIINENKDLWIDFVKNVVDPIKVKRNGLSILKIDLNRIKKYNISFYRDTAMGDDAVFTYNNIPKECITKLNIK